MSTKHEFQAEVRQLLDLMVHSIYSNKDVFLRELISNASDALDKLRFEQITHESLRQAGTPAIELKTDGEARTLTISDNGIGMTRDEVVKNIGTIAKSGTKEFLAAVKEKQSGEAAPDLIGQFGVGFYSAFMVADKIELITRRAGEDKAIRWVSEGLGGFEMEEATRPEWGTTITLFLKPADEENGIHDYTSEHVLRRIVKQYSDFVAYPICMTVWREWSEKEGGETGKVLEALTLNSMKAIWSRSKGDVSDSEYVEFYKHISHDWNEPLLHLPIKIEGTFLAHALLYIPSKAPFDLFHREMKRGIQLYVKRIFIMDECKDILPDHLRFVRGVVDAEDLSLNVSREILQKNRQIQVIRKQLVKKVYGALEDLLASDREKYLGFWNEMGTVLKEGFLRGEDGDGERLSKLLLLSSTHHPSEPTTLDAYVERMKPGQDAIYYLNGPSREAIERSPHLEAFKEKGYEVLLLSHQIDEFWPDSLAKFQDKRFVSIAKGNVELGSAEEKKEAEARLKSDEQTYHDLLSCLRVQLQDEIKEVRLSQRLTSSPACLVSDEGELSPQMAKLLEQMGQKPGKVKRNLEVNPRHPLVTGLQRLFRENGKHPQLGEYAKILYGQAVLAEGGTLADPSEFSRLVGELMVRVLPVEDATKTATD